LAHDGANAGSGLAWASGRAGRLGQPIKNSMLNSVTEEGTAMATRTANSRETGTADRHKVRNAGESTHYAAPRFHVFVLDTGWHSEAAAALRENLAAIAMFAEECPFFVLTAEQSRMMLLRDPGLIGKGPSLIVHDLHAQGGRGSYGYHGFRLNLGGIPKREAALRALQEFLHFTFTHRDESDIENALRKKLHREGLVNAIEVLHRAI
jgi:hypothetical protein